MVKLISNPAGAYGETGIDNNARVVHERVCSTAVLARDVVTFDVMTGTDELLSVHSGLTTDDPALVAGVALHDAAAGEVVKVVEFGPAIVDIGANTVTAGMRAQRDGVTAGNASGVTADATTIAGDTFGVFLSANDVPGTDQAIVFVRG